VPLCVTLHSQRLAQCPSEALASQLYCTAQASLGLEHSGLYQPSSLSLPLWCTAQNMAYRKTSWPSLAVAK